MKRIELVLWFKCNTRCAFCVVDAQTARQSFDTADAIASLQDFRRDGAVEVDFGGGEPTLRADLPELARRAKALGYRRVGVKSNGLRLCYPDFVERLMETGVERFAVPIWGDGPEIHDRLCRTPGAFERLEMGVKNVLDLGAELSVDVLLTRATVPRLTEIVERFSALGVKRFSAWLFCLFGSGGALPGLMPTLTDAGRAFASAAESAAGRGVRLSTSQIPPCFLGPAAGLYENVADLELEIVTPGGSFLAETSPFEAGRKTPHCRGCARRARCAGIRPEYLQRFGDREIKKAAA